MKKNEYHERIVQYYHDTEHAYKDSWDLNNSLAIHYGYWDDQVKSFPESLLRMNEIMMQTAAIQSTDSVLDAGCGVGGSSIYLASRLGCTVTGITLSQRQATQATKFAKEKNQEHLVSFTIMDYCNTDFNDESFHVVWGCESICYADDKEKFIKEAYRILKPGGRLIIADGFVTSFENNQQPVIRKWLDGWQVNYLETPERFLKFLKNAGFVNTAYKNISKEATRSSQRLYRFYFLAKLYLAWKKINFSKPATEMQKKNIEACKYQYIGVKKRFWEYGIVVATKPDKNI